MTDVDPFASGAENQSNPGVSQPDGVVNPNSIGGRDERDGDSNMGPENDQSQDDLALDSIISGPLSPATESECDDEEGDDSESDDEDEESDDDEETRLSQARRARRWTVLEILAYDYFKQRYLILWKEVKRLNLTKTISWEPRGNVVEDKSDPRLPSTIFWKKRPKKAATNFLQYVVLLCD